MLRASIIDPSQLAIRHFILEESYVEEREEMREKRADALRSAEL
jgi:hypothetical protein